MSLDELLSSTQALLIFVLMRIIDGPNNDQEVGLHLLTTAHVHYSVHIIGDCSSDRIFPDYLQENGLSQQQMQKRALEHTYEQR